MFKRFIKWLDDRGSSRMITRRFKETGEVGDYLKRHFILETSNKSVYLHQFWASDPDDFHDHPSDYIRIRLTGKYMEYNVDGSFRWSLPFEITYRRAEDFHRIELPNGGEGKGWSLFIFLKRRRDWGFLYNGRWMAAGEYGKLVNNPVEIRGVDYEMKGKLFPRYIKLKES